jgi:hypothetical protein
LLLLKRGLFTPAMADTKTLSCASLLTNASSVEDFFR